MLMGDNNLFRWNRITEPRAYSRSNKLTTEDDIEKWLERIDTAANQAVVRGHRSASAGRAAGRRDNGVYGEARQLLNSWLQKKESATSELFDETETEGRAVGPDRLQIKREWDRLLGGVKDSADGDQEEVKRKDDVSAHNLSLAALLADGGGALAQVAASAKREEAEEETVEAVMRRMLSKQYVNRKQLRRLEEAPTPACDLKSKLELRQERAKENRLQRQQAAEQRRKEALLKREAEAEARKMVQEEEKRMAMQARREEEMIQQEMVRIRKELQEKRRKEEEEAEKLKRQHLEELARKKLERRQREEEEDEVRLLELQRRQDQIRVLVQEGQQRQKTHDLRLLQRCFAAWYSVVLDRRLQLGRAGAISDWRQLRLAFHAWRDLTRRRRLDAEAALAAELAIREQRNLRVAVEFSRTNLLRRCLLEWRTWVLSERLRRQEAQMEESKRRKMAAFLEAAAASAANVDEPGDDAQEGDQVEEEIALSDRRPVVEPLESARPASSQQSQKTRHNRASSAGKLGRRVEPPREAWQVHRGHVRQLPLDTIVTDRQPTTSKTQEDSPEHASKPWNQPVKIMNQFANRHRQQQEMLKEQARRLDEQARMIEELQSQHRIAALQDNVNALRAQRQQQQQQPPPRQRQPAPDVEGAGPRPEEAGAAQAEEMSTVSTGRTEDSGKSASTANGRQPPRQPARRDPILQRMEERAAERARIKAEREERRREAERKKAVEAAAHVEELRRQEEEERQAKAREARERRRAERQLEQEKLARANELREQTARADDFRTKAQLRWRGLVPWRRLMALRSEQTKMADQQYTLTLQSRCMAHWLQFVAERKAAEDAVVERFRRRQLLKRYFRRWTLLKHCTEVMELKAAEFNNCRIMLSVLRQWASVTMDAKIRLWELERQAREHDNRRVMRRCFGAWRRLPGQLREERERERRREELRRRVQAIVPDFAPPISASAASLSDQFESPT